MRLNTKRLVKDLPFLDRGTVLVKVDNGFSEHLGENHHDGSSQLTLTSFYWSQKAFFARSRTTTIPQFKRWVGVNQNWWTCPRVGSKVLDDASYASVAAIGAADALKTCW